MTFFIRYIIEGVMSFGTKCWAEKKRLDQDRPSYFARVSFQMPTITAIVSVIAN